MPEMAGPFTAEVLRVGWATSGVTGRGDVVLALAASQGGEQLVFSMEPRLAAALHATLGQAIAMAGGNEEEKH